LSGERTGGSGSRGSMSDRVAWFLRSKDRDPRVGKKRGPAPRHGTERDPEDTGESAARLERLRRSLGASAGLRLCGAGTGLQAGRYHARGVEQSEHTTVAVQNYLDALAVDATADPIIRSLLARSAARLETLCANMLHRSYPRLARPPVNLHEDELLDALVERLLKALRAVRPQNVRQFFGLANQHIRWELNALARRLDEHPPAVAMDSQFAAAPPPPSEPPLTPNAVTMLQAIANLPEDERETFGLVRIQGLSYPQAAEILGVSGKTVQRRINRSLLHLSQQLEALRPSNALPSEKK
jgi:RNA polymerase sigma factor (sigma-70 family)